MTDIVTDKELAEIQECCNNANDGWPRDKLTFDSHAYQDIPRLIAALGQARKQLSEPLRQAAPQLLAALEETLEEIAYCHGDMLSEDERRHPRGNGWARVYDKSTAAIALAKRVAA
jgi:hypothetical protein